MKVAAPRRDNGEVTPHNPRRQRWRCELSHADRTPAVDVETALRRNGFSGEQLLKLAHKAANDALRRAGGGIASPHC